MHYQPKQDLLNDRIILVTGASDGIGREAAMTYARYGATVILLGRNEEKLRQVASHINEETGRQPQWFILDLLTCTSEDCQQLAQRIAVNYPRLDGVLHNAGLLGDVCPMSEQNPQVWQDVMQVNVNATRDSTDDLHRQFLPPHRCQDYHGQSGHHPAYYQPAGSLRYGYPAGPRTAHPRCLSPVLHH